MKEAGVVVEIEEKVEGVTWVRLPVAGDDEGFNEKRVVRYSIRKVRNSQSTVSDFEIRIRMMISATEWPRASQKEKE